MQLCSKAQIAVHKSWDVKIKVDFKARVLFSKLKDGGGGEYSCDGATVVMRGAASVSGVENRSRHDGPSSEPTPWDKVGSKHVRLALDREKDRAQAWLR
jgi:hypothetical protein